MNWYKLWTVLTSDHSISKYKKLSKKLVFRTPYYTHIHAYQGVRDVSFLENFANVRTEWMRSKEMSLAKLILKFEP